MALRLLYQEPKEKRGQLHNKEDLTHGLDTTDYRNSDIPFGSPFHLFSLERAEPSLSTEGVSTLTN